MVDHRFLNGAVVLVTMLALGACQQTGPTFTAAEYQDPGPIIGGSGADMRAPAVDDSNRDARLLLGQDVLRGRIVLDQARIRELGALKQAEVVVVNDTQDLFQLEYRVDWQDDDDFQVESGAWRRFTLAGYERFSIQSTGGTPAASKVTVTVRLPDEVIR